MPNRLLQVVTSTALAAGATEVLTIGLSNNNNALKPDILQRDNPVFEIVACTATQLTVTNVSDSAATCNFFLTYFQSTQRVFGDNATQQLSPAPFIVGGAAGTVPATSAPSSVVLQFQPGGTGAGLTVFNSFSALYAELVALRTANGGGKYAIGYDDSLAAVTVPAGTYDLTNVDQIGLGSTPVLVTYADGTVFTGARSWKNLIIVNANTTTAPITDAVAGDEFFLERAVLSSTTASIIPVIRLLVTGTFSIWMSNGSALAGGSSLGGTETGRVVGVGGGPPAKHLQIFMDASCALPVPDALVGAGGSDILIEAPSGTQIPVVTTWISAAANPILFNPPSFRSNPYLGVPSNAPVVARHGQWLRINSTGNITQPLPAISTATSSLSGAGVALTVSNVSGGGLVTLTPEAGDTIMGLATWPVPDGVTVTFISDGLSNWQLMATSDVAVPQKLVSPRWDGADGTTALVTNATRAFLLGYAARNFEENEGFIMSWRNVGAGVGITWGEMAVGVGFFSAGDTPVGITPVGFANIATQLATAATNFQTGVTIASGNRIAKGQAIYGIIGCTNVTTDPTVLSGPADVQGSGYVMVNTTAGWRPSLQLGVVGTFAIDTSRQVPKQVWSS